MMGRVGCSKQPIRVFSIWMIVWDQEQIPGMREALRAFDICVKR
jgi:hypothetical protein